MLTLLLRDSKTTDEGIVAYGVLHEDVKPEVGQLVNVMGSYFEIRNIEKSEGQEVGLLLGHEITLYGGPKDGETVPTKCIENPDWPISFSSIVRGDDDALYFGQHIYVPKHNRFVYDRTDRGHMYSKATGLIPINDEQHKE